MIPASYPVEMAPLQRGYNSPPGQPGVSTVVQYTSVNVTSKPPKDHIIWSISNFVYSNVFCLGLAALIFSVKSRDRKTAGDLEAARRHGSTARNLNIAATVLGVIAFIIVIVMTCILGLPFYGYSDGHSDGYSVGYSVGYDKGNSVGNSEGYNKGYSEGYNKGYSEGNSYGNRYRY